MEFRSSSTSLKYLIKSTFFSHTIKIKNILTIIYSTYGNPLGNLNEVNSDEKTSLNYAYGKLLDDLVLWVAILTHDLWCSDQLAKTFIEVDFSLLRQSDALMLSTFFVAYFEPSGLHWFIKLFRKKTKYFICQLQLKFVSRFWSKILFSTFAHHRRHSQPMPKIPNWLFQTFLNSNLWPFQT